MRAALAVPIAAGVVLSLAAGCAPSRNGVERAEVPIRPEAIRAHMSFLAHDLLEGRRPGTRGYRLAAEYVATELERMGLEPAGVDGGFFQPVPLRGATLQPAASSFTLVGEGGARELRLGEDVVLTPPFDGETRRVEARLLFAGYGVQAPELGHDDYAGLDAAGRIVLVLSGAPSELDSTERAVYSSRETKAEAALRNGAVGLFVLRTPVDEARVPWDVVRRRSAEPVVRWRDPETGLPDSPSSRLAASGTLSRNGAKALLAGAPLGLDELFARAERDEAPKFPLDLEATVVSAGSFDDFESPNVLAKLPGSDPTLATEHVVFSAHLDHVGIGAPDENGDPVYNGAYDNASGVAVVLAVAEAFSRLETAPRRSLLFLAVTAEEEGLLGSDYFVHHPTVPVSSIVADVNVDGVLMFHPLKDVVAFGAEHSTLAGPVSEAAAELGVGLSPDFMPEEVIFLRSDQYSFVRQGIPAVYAFVGVDTGDSRVDGERVLREWMTSVYHHPSDDMSQELDFQAGADYARLVFGIGARLAASDERPVWNEGDFLGVKFAAPARR